MNQDFGSAGRNEDALQREKQLDLVTIWMREQQENRAVKDSRGCELGWVGGECYVKRGEGRWKRRGKEQT